MLYGLLTAWIPMSASLSACFALLWLSLPSLATASVHARKVTVLLTDSASADLPCDLGTRDERAVKAWWHRGDNPTQPVYTLEAPVGRKGTINLSQARHTVGPSLVGRAHFSVVRTPALLSILRLRYEDRGVYVCNVEFERSPRRSYDIELEVIIPPSDPVILNENMTAMNGTVGPYNEGALLILHCHVNGGKPEPRVVWRQGTTQLHRVYHQTEEGVKKATLHVRTLRREHLGTTFTCEASNNNLTEPARTSVKLTMNLKPVRAIIRGKQDFLSAEFPTEVECEAEGSLPPAAISWWLDSKPIDASEALTRVLAGGNSTASLLRFVPRADDNGKQLRCVAVNPKMSSHDKVQDIWTLQVHYKPRAVLRWGHRVNASSIVQGQDVYLECDVEASPRHTDIGWRFNGADLSTSRRTEGAQIVLSNQSLALRGVQRHDTGHYSCVATNAEGTVESNQVILRVQYLPVCGPGQRTVYSASRHEEIRITCTVIADPANNVTFHWSFNSSSGHPRDISPALYSTLPSPESESRGRSSSTVATARSLLQYTPRNESDYGTLSCSARNAVGLMMRPCVYHVVFAGPPQPLRNCSLSEQTKTSFRVDCWPPTGLPEPGLRYLLEVYELHSRRLVANYSSLNPRFRVQDLSSGSQCTLLLYSANERGRSEPLLLTAHTLANTAQGYSEPGKPWIISSKTLLFLLITASFLLVLLPFVIVLALRYRNKAPEEPDEKEVHQEKHFTASNSNGTRPSNWIQLSQGVEHRSEPGVFPEEAFVTTMTSFQAPVNEPTEQPLPSFTSPGVSDSQGYCPRSVC
ncbi:hemicentin-2-like [Ornithodoros turicata]|uniref:hemicentin-2-like n=1 Tax=Ornithodoros turicata TaxID=34597 RepID=UPI003138D820